MRLTLRTLLAYLDDTLEGDAREQLREQIETSDAAVAWVHRTRDVMGRLRLGAAEPDADDGVNDANRVAEYLDRVMPEEDVAEFERVCLESDAGLAEVAACHHVLALVLGDQGEIDPDTRRRLVGLRDELAAAMQSPSVSAGGVAAERLVAAASEEADGLATVSLPTEALPPVTLPPVDRAGEDAAPPVAPDYLRDPDGPGPLKSWGLAVAAAVLLAVTALLVADPAGLFREAAPEKAELAAATVDPDPVSPPSEPSPSTSTAIEEPAEATTEEAAPESEVASTDTVSDEVPGKAEPGPADGEALESDPTAAEETPESPTAETAEIGENASVNGEEPAAPEPWLVATRGRQLLLAETAPDRWRRLANGAVITEPTRLVVPPAYESEFELGPNVTLRTLSETDLTLTGVREIEGADAVGPSRIGLAFGRIVISCRQDAPQSETLAIALDGIDYEVVLGPGAAMALHAERPYTAGHPVQELPASLLAVAHSLVGPVEWSGPRGGATHAGAESWVAVGDRLAGVPPAFRDPGWITEGDSPSIADRSAAPRLAERDDLDEPVWQRLMTLADPQENRLSEVRRLSARVALMLGHPEPLVESFAQPEERQQWASNLAELRRASSRGTASAKAIVGAFAAKYGEQVAEELAEMLSGYTPEEVGRTATEFAEGVIGEAVIPRLQSEELVLRVLASLILDETVEQPAAGFNPLDDTSKRRRVYRKLTKSLEDNELQPLVK